MHSFLHKQLDISDINKTNRKIAQYIIDSLDISGYLTLDIKTLAAQFFCSEACIHNLLNKLKMFEPTGVFASNLAECLELQLIEMNLYNNQYSVLLKNLTLLIKNDIEKIANLCGVSCITAKEMINIIKGLNPKPGAKFAHTEQNITSPADAKIFLSAKNEIIIEPYDEYLNNIAINHALYNQMLKSTKDSNSIKEWVNCYKDAVWLYKAISNRQKTILLVAKTIADKQYDFFMDGPKYLRPLILKDVAEAVNLHESTISRVSGAKIETKFGIFKLKYFFSSKIKSSIYENCYSSIAVKETIKDMIKNEEVCTPLSDDNIALKLRGQGMIISRRTVAKYREEINIPSSYWRKRSK